MFVHQTDVIRQIKTSSKRVMIAYRFPIEIEYDLLNCPLGISVNYHQSILTLNNVLFVSIETIYEA